MYIYTIYISHRAIRFLSVGPFLCGVYTYVHIHTNSMYIAWYSLSPKRRDPNGHRNSNRNPGWLKFMFFFEWAVWEETHDDHSGFQFVFRWPFRVSSCRERAVCALHDFLVLVFFHVWCTYIWRIQTHMLRVSAYLMDRVGLFQYMVCMNMYIHVYMYMYICIFTYIHICDRRCHKICSIMKLDSWIYHALLRIYWAILRIYWALADRLGSFADILNYFADISSCLAEKELFRGYWRFCCYWKSDVHLGKCGWFRIYRAHLRIYRVHLRIFCGYPRLCCYWKSHMHYGRCGWFCPRRFEQGWKPNCTARLPCTNPQKVSSLGNLLYTTSVEMTFDSFYQSTKCTLLNRYRADFWVFVPKVRSALHTFYYQIDSSAMSLYSGISGELTFEKIHQSATSQQRTELMLYYQHCAYPEFKVTYKMPWVPIYIYAYIIYVCVCVHTYIYTHIHTYALSLYLI